MINNTIKTLVIAGMSVALIGGAAQAKNNKKRGDNGIQKSESWKKKINRSSKKRLSKRNVRNKRLKQNKSLANQKLNKSIKRTKNVTKRLNEKRQNNIVLDKRGAKGLKTITPPPDRRVTIPKTILSQDKRVTTPKTVVTQKSQDPTSGRLNARKNKDEYFNCAKFSTTVLNACIADANRKGQTTKSCLTHYQGNIGRCQAKFL